MNIIRSTQLEKHSSPLSSTKYRNDQVEMTAIQPPSTKSKTTKKSVAVSAKRSPTKTKSTLKPLYKDLEFATLFTSSSQPLPSSHIPFNDDRIQSIQTSTHRRRYMRRGSRAPSMMFQLEVAAAISAEVIEQMSNPCLHEKGERGGSKNDPLFCCVDNQGRSKEGTDMAANDSLLSSTESPNNNDVDGEEFTMATTQSKVSFPTTKEDPLHGYDPQRSPSIISLLGSQLDKSVSFW